MKRAAQQNIRNEESIANSTTTFNDIVAAEADCGKGVRTGTESSDADGYRKKDQSATAPKERQQAVSEAETGAEISGSVALMESE